MHQFPVVLFPFLFLLILKFDTVAQDVNNSEERYFTIGSVEFDLFEPLELEEIGAFEYSIRVGEDKIYVCKNQGKGLTACNLYALPTTNFNRMSEWIQSGKISLEAACSQKPRIMEKGKFTKSGFCVDYQIKEQFELYSISYLIYNDKSSIPVIQFTGKEVSIYTVAAIDKMARSMKLKK